MKILSLFDWMSCCQIAINNLGITNYTYYASEIDKFAIKTTKINFPSTIHIWDITKIKWNDFKDIYLIAWWSPCQWFSFQGKWLNFNDNRSKLFFEFVRLIKEIKPKYFLLENVKMKKEYLEIISKELFWIEPICINSNLTTAQNRVRYYWIWKLNKNWEYEKVKIDLPKDKGIKFQDILTDTNNNLSEKWINYHKNAKFISDIPIDWFKIDKSPTLLTSRRCFKFWDNYKKLNSTEMLRLQDIPENYFDNTNISETQKYKMIWNAWTVSIIEHIFKYIFK